VKKPYIKKYGEMSHFIIYIVDGNYIRTNIDEEFTNFGQHYRFKYIPKNEFWIDLEHGKSDESKFFIDHLLLENRLMAQGKNYSFAEYEAEKKEKLERIKTDSILKKNKQNDSELINKIHIKQLKKFSGKVKVWLVDGRLVRDLYRVQFTEGGHDLVYSFIPPKEIWIDDDVSPKERKYIILHELYERNLMAKGWTYDLSKNTNSAHFAASHIEYKCRHNPKLLMDCLKAEVVKSDKLY
jgi:hypothetical protein